VIGQHLKTTELAELLSLNPETLRRAAARGELKPIRIGRDLIWPVDDVRAWLDRNRVDNSRVVPIRRQTPASTNTRRSA
jgi:excisionase family DNA binding protein